MERFAHLARQARNILDVGGTVNFWEAHLDLLPPTITVTVINLDCAVDIRGEGRIFAQYGDARRMSFKEKQFDLCFSNSVLEHVGTLHDQRLAAAEIRRVSYGYFVQTPNRFFPIEPHFLIPGWQFLPFWIRAFALRRFKIGWMPQQLDPLVARAEVEQVRLISAGELRGLFPDGQLWREKVGPLTKSLVAWKEPAAA